MVERTFRGIHLVLPFIVCGTLSFSAALGKRVPLTDAEKATLTFICEEEKLAKEVYETYFTWWNLAIFDNIAGAEAKHLAGVQKMAVKFGADDPTVLAGFGEFTDPNLQSLFNEMTDPGLVTLDSEGLWVGGFIEETDIGSLLAAIEELTLGSDAQPLLSVYDHLLRGSRNHLRAFVRRIESQGDVYEAQVLDPDLVDEIVDSGTERGPHRGDRR